MLIEKRSLVANLSSFPSIVSLVYCNGISVPYCTQYVSLSKDMSTAVHEMLAECDFVLTPTVATSFGGATATV